MGIMGKLMKSKVGWLLPYSVPERSEGTEVSKMAIRHGE